MKMENNMKKNIVLLLMIVLVVGCGSKEEKKEVKGGGQQTVVKSQQYIARGMQYLNEKDIVKAIRSFDMAIKMDPANPENYLILGQVYLRLKNYQGAVDTLMAALRVAPNNPEVYYLLATCRGLRWEDEDKEKAIEAAQKSVELFMQSKNEEKFKKAVVLLKSLTQKVQQQ